MVVFMAASNPYLEFIHTKHSLLRSCSVSWTASPFGTFKLNVDGSARGASSPIGGGIVLRDTHGDIVFAASLFLGTDTSFQAEVLALKHGLRHCVQNSFSPLYVVSDSQVLVRLLANRRHWLWRVKQVLAEICVDLDVSNCVVTHVYRETNAVADILANEATNTL